MDQIAAMRAFVRVVESGTFTRAAVLLGVPKPTLTKQVQLLEAHLRTKLLNRTTRRVSVTPDGAAYYERAIRLLADLDELDGSMAQSQARPQGRLRVDIGSAVGTFIVIPALPDFHARYPEIQLDLGVSDRQADLVAENVDCVVRVGELLDPSLVARRVADLQMVACAAPAYLDGYGTPGHPSELMRGHYTVGFFNARTGRPFPLELNRPGETFEAVIPHIVALNDGNAYLAAVRAGLGIGLVPDFVAETYLARGTLRRVLPEWTVEPFPIHVVYPPNRHLSNRLRVFVDWVAGVLARRGTGRGRQA